jgi:O-acetyl-ADP-ribose deacetylase (regulator of RNase III)
VGPIYDREGAEAPRLLASCYASALNLCRRHSIDSIAFPSISTGVYGYPLDEAAPIALQAVRDGLLEPEAPELCRFVLFDAGTLNAYEQAAQKLFC